MDRQENQEEYSFVRNNYYPGKLLRAGDFVREQEYGNAKREFINRKLHGCGIIEGLEVRTGDGGALRIAAGSAIDFRGRIVLVPEEIRMDAKHLKGLDEEEINEFVLGIRYDEEQVEKEQSIFDGKESSKGMRIKESYALKAYSLEEWEQMRSEDDVANLLAEERILYQDAQLKLSLRIPIMVPADSIFKIRMEAKTLGEESIFVGWRGTMKLQGAFFLLAGKSLQELEQKLTLVSDSFYQEWEICTEEYRKQLVAMELSRLEIFRQGAEPVQAEVYQTDIGTAEAYEESARKYLQKKRKKRRQADWIPLARLRFAEDGNGSGVFSMIEEPRIRRYVVQTEETKAIRKALEENGIIDIKWRNLLQRPMPQPVSSQPAPTELPEPMPLKAEESRIHRGITVIPIPRRYRRGEPLFSEEIAHGFPGEEVFLWVDRIYEEINYAYWEHDRKKYAAVHGSDELFSDGWDSGWKIRKQAVRQNIETGTFQIALVLSGGRRKNQSKEVAFSWTAVRLPQPMKSS